MPKAPGLLMTRKLSPVIFWMASPTMRAVISVAPPGAYGTSTLIGRFGYFSCAEAAAMPSARNAERQAADSRIAVRRFMGILRGNWLPAGILFGLRADDVR